MIELVAKLHEHQKIKYDIMHLLIIVFLLFVTTLVDRCVQLKVVTEGKHTLVLHRII